MAPHLYWRLFINLNNGDTDFTAVGELEFRATPLGADQANGGTAIASSEGNPASAAFDGVRDSSGAPNTTYWTTTAGAHADCWIGYIFPAPVEVAAVEVFAARDMLRLPKNMRVEWSDDGVAWTEAFRIRSQTYWPLGEARVFTAPTEKRFGEMWAGETEVNFPFADNKSGTVYTLTETADVSKLAMWVPSSPAPQPNFRGLIYRTAGGVPSELVAATNSRYTIGVVGWYDLLFPSPVRLEPGDYWLGVQADQNILSQGYSGTSGNYFNADAYSDGPSDPFGAASTSATRKTIYAAYTVASTDATGTGQATLDALTSAGGGTAFEAVTGTGQATLDALTGLAAGTGSDPVTGTGAAELAALTSAALAVQAISPTRHRIGLNATWVHQPS